MRAAILILSAVALAACSRSADAREHDDSLSGVAGHRDFQVGAFEAVALRGSHDVIVTVGGAPSVRAEGDTKALERLEVEVKNGKLVIGSKRKRGWFNNSDGESNIIVHVTVPSLTGAAIEGSGDLKVDKVQGERFNAAIAGSGDMEIGDMRVQRGAFSIAGSGGIRARGSADASDVSIAGSGDIDISGVQSKTANISIAGSGDVRAQASETADVSIMGSGDVTLAGSAKCSISKLGSGDVHCGG